MTAYEEIGEEGAYDPLGTVRVHEAFGSVGVYIRCGPDKWLRVYVSTKDGSHYASDQMLSDWVASVADLVYTPKKLEQ